MAVTPRQRRIAFSYLFAVYLLCGMAETLISPLFPLVRDDLGLVEAQQATLLATVAACIAIFNVVGGALATRMADRHLVRIAAAILSVGLVVTGASVSFPMMLAGQALVGVGVRAVLPVRAGQHRPPVRGGTRSGHRQLRPRLLDRPRHRRRRRRRRRRQLAMGVLRLGHCRRRPGGVGAAMDRGRSGHRATRAVPPAAGVRAAARVPDLRARDDHRARHALRGHRVCAGALRRPWRLADARQPAARRRPAGLDPRQGAERHALRPLRRDVGGEDADAGSAGARHPDAPHPGRWWLVALRAVRRRLGVGVPDRQHVARGRPSTALGMGHRDVPFGDARRVSPAVRAPSASCCTTCRCRR